MLRAMDTTGWWLVRHPDHARLAGEFASHWGNRLFRAPEPRGDVLEGIRRHDDGWATRDASPVLTRQGKPSAFGADLVGKYTAFEEIDLPEYLGVRGRALEVVAAENAYAAILISMHTCNLLTAHADRSTIRPDQLPDAGAAGCVPRGRRVPGRGPRAGHVGRALPALAGVRQPLVAGLRGLRGAGHVAASLAHARRGHANGGRGPHGAAHVPPLALAIGRAAGSLHRPGTPCRRPPVRRRPAPSRPPCGGRGHAPSHLHHARLNG